MVLPELIEMVQYAVLQPYLHALLAMDAALWWMPYYADPTNVNLPTPIQPISTQHYRYIDEFFCVMWLLSEKRIYPVWFMLFPGHKKYLEMHYLPIETSSNEICPQKGKQNHYYPQGGFIPQTSITNISATSLRQPGYLYPVAVLCSPTDWQSISTCQSSNEWRWTLSLLALSI